MDQLVSILSTEEEAEMNVNYNLIIQKYSRTVYKEEVSPLREILGVVR